MTQAQEWADALGESQADAAWLQAETARLRKKAILPLDHVSHLHNWWRCIIKG